MYIKILGSIQTEICVEYLPNEHDILFIKGAFYRVNSRYYNTDIEEWALRVGSYTTLSDIENMWKEPPQTKERFSLDFTK